MNPLHDLFPLVNHNWYLGKKRKTHFADNKNEPGKPIGWWDAIKKLKREHTEGKLTVETVETLTTQALGSSGYEGKVILIDDSPITS